jgi:hypothetical protein
LALAARDAVTLVSNSLTHSQIILWSIFINK